MDIQIMTEKGTNKPRGFGFAIFDDCDTVDKICIKKFIRIKVSVNVGAYGGRGKVFVCRGERYTYVKYSVVKKEVGGQFSLYFSM